MSLKELLKSNLPRAVLIIIIYVIAALATTMNTYFLKFATDYLVKGNLQNAVMWLLANLVMGLLSFFLMPLGTYLFNQQVQRYLHQVRERIMKHYYNQGSAKVAEMQNQLGNNLKVLTDNFANPWIDILSTLLTVLMAITAMFTLHWSIVLATALVTIIVLLLPKIMEKRLAKSAALAATKNSAFLNTIANWFSGLSELRRYHAKKNLKQAINKKSQDLAKANIQQKKLEGTADIINSGGNTVGQLGIGLWGAILFFSQQITIGGLMASSTFASSIFNSLWKIVQAMIKIKSTKELRLQVAQLATPANEKAKSLTVDGVQAHQLVVQYPHGEMITYPDFEIKPGEKVLLTGDSGTGKSTLFKVLLGQIKPIHGDVLFSNADLQAIKPEMAQIGYIAQDASLFPDTIANNITMFNEQLQQKLTQTIAKVSLSTDIAKFSAGSETIIDLDQNNLSGGQKQKVVLARAEIHETEFLLLDEATSAIDKEATMQIIGELLQSKATILLIAHNLTSELRAQFDREIHLIASNKKGKQNDN